MLIEIKDSIDGIGLHLGQISRDWTPRPYGRCYPIYDTMHKANSWAPAKAKSYTVENLGPDPSAPEHYDNIYVTYFTTRAEGQYPVYRAKKGEPSYQWTDNEQQEVHKA